MTRCSDEDGDARGRQSHGHGYTADTIPSHPEAERGPRTQPLAAGPGGHGPLSSGTSGPAAALRPARGRRGRGSGHSLSGAKASPRHPEPPKHTKREEELGCAGGSAAERASPPQSTDLPTRTPRGFLQSSGVRGSSRGQGTGRVLARGPRREKPDPSRAPGSGSPHGHGPAAPVPAAPSATRARPMPED